jgi:hypothetical protein
MAVTVISATFTPAASSHNGGDCCGAAARFETAVNIGTDGFVVKNASVMIADGTAVTSAFTVQLYSVTPPSAIADDAVWDLAAVDRTSYLGPVAVAATVDTGASQFGETQTHHKIIDLPATATGVWGYLVITTTSTLAAQPITVKLAIETSR